MSTPDDRERRVGRGNPPTRFTTYTHIPSKRLATYRKRHRWPKPNPSAAGVRGDKLTERRNAERPRT